MRGKPTFRISKKALSVWRIKGVIATAIFSMVPLILFFIYYRFQLPLFYVWVSGISVAVYGLWQIVILPKIRWNMWRYEVYGKEIELLRGVFIARHTLIPMTRVQHVDTEQGPIYKRYGLTTVTISTAAGVHEIPALSEQVGSRLRDQIAYLAGTEEDDE
ncbi:PH domain-containing protein [Alteribacillus sp. JSM 102045]|uniref:PH domain-containing protein n=1 Tax=Alteribacillus sp. JSM 102045 TaxID=1562101 RepID=UPI0035C25582